MSSMSRAWLIEHKGALYHVLSRDNERYDILVDEDDRNGFIDAIEHPSQGSTSTFFYSR